MKITKTIHNYYNDGSIDKIDFDVISESITYNTNIRFITNHSTPIIILFEYKFI